MSSAGTSTAPIEALSAQRAYYDEIATAMERAFQEHTLDDSARGRVNRDRIRDRLRSLQTERTEAIVRSIDREPIFYPPMNMDRHMVDPSQRLIQSREENAMKSIRSTYDVRQGDRYHPLSEVLWSGDDADRKWLVRCAAEERARDEFAPHFQMLDEVKINSACMALARQAFDGCVESLYKQLMSLRQTRDPDTAMKDFERWHITFPEEYLKIFLNTPNNTAIDTLRLNQFLFDELCLEYYIGQHIDGTTYEECPESYKNDQAATTISSLAHIYGESMKRPGIPGSKHRNGTEEGMKYEEMRTILCGLLIGRTMMFISNVQTTANAFVRLAKKHHEERLEAQSPAKQEKKYDELNDKCRRLLQFLESRAEGEGNINNTRETYILRVKGLLADLEEGEECLESIETRFIRLEKQVLAAAINKI